MLDIIYIYVLNLFEDIYIFLKKLYNLIEIKNKNYIAGLTAYRGERGKI